jgi:hypothetical protein
MDQNFQAKSGDGALAPESANGASCAVERIQSPALPFRPAIVDVVELPRSRGETAGKLESSSANGKGMQVVFSQEFPNQFLVDSKNPHLRHEKGVVESLKQGTDLEVMSVGHGRWVMASELYGGFLGDEQERKESPAEVAAMNTLVEKVQGSRESRSASRIDGRQAATGPGAATAEVEDMHWRKSVVRGNQVPSIWLRQLRRKDGPDFPACHVLAEIVRWYKPAVTSEYAADGKPLKLRRQFAADILQKSRRDLCEELALSLDQVKAALKKLEDFRLISRELRTVVARGQRHSNVLYIRLHPDVLCLLDNGVLNPLGVVNPHARWSSAPRSEARYADIYIKDASTTHTQIKSPKPPLGKGGSSISQEIATFTPGNGEGEKSHNSSEITTRGLSTLPSSADPRFPKVGGRPDWSGAVEKYDLDNAKIVAGLFQDGEQFWSCPGLARTYCKLRINGVLDDRTVALFGRFYREAHSDDTPEVEWKTSAIRKFLKRRVIANASSVVASHVEYEIENIRNAIHLRQTSDGFRADIASAKMLLSEGQTLCYAESIIDRNPGAAAAWLIVAAEMKMDVGAYREKWQEFVRRDFAVFHELRAYFRRKQIDPVAVFGLNDAEIDAIIEADVVWARDAEAKLVALRDGSIDPLSQCMVSSP